MDIQQIEKEIDRFKNHLDLLENRLKEAQQNCDHHFNGNQYFEKCTKCNKVNVLYY